MTSISTVLLAGLSGLRAAQTGLAVASQNISNANTPGYVRAELTLEPRSQIGAGAGVEVSTIRRAADRFLTTASFVAEATRGAASVRANILTRAQASFGDPTSSTSLFSSLDQFWTALTELSVDPSSALRHSDAIGALQTTYAEVRRVGATIQDLIGEADQRITDSVAKAQDLIDRIAELNNEIRLSKRSGADATGVENAQSVLIDQLSTLMDVRTTPQLEGGVHVRTTGGALLVGVQAARLSYTPSASAYATHGVITLNADLGTQSNLEPFLIGGEIKGLLQVRDEDLVGLAEALGGFAGALGDAMNAVHNENTSSPAPSQLVGRQTGLLGSDALAFTGNAIVGVTDADGVLRNRLTIDFDTGVITGEAPAASYTMATGDIAGFVAALNTALAASTPAGSASFSAGQMTLNVGAGGLVVQQDGADPSQRGGRGFAHFFGLNDIVSRPTPLFFEAGLQGSDVHGFNAGGALTYQIRDNAGRMIGERTITISGALTNPASTWNDLLGALNASGTGIGEFGAFSLDPTTGRVSFAAGSGGHRVQLVGDSTQRGATGVSLTALHGLSKTATAGRSEEVDVNDLLAADPLRLAVGRPDLSAALGQRIVELGDNRGVAAMAAAKNVVRPFSAAGALSAQSTTLATYASRLGGEAGRMSADAERGARGAEAVAAAAADRRAQIEGVNLDDELLRMTTYQNAYAAAARVIQAATDMLDVLMSIGYR